MVKYQQILHPQAFLGHQSFRQAVKAEHSTQSVFLRARTNLETTIEGVDRHRGRGTI